MIGGDGKAQDYEARTWDNGFTVQRGKKGKYVIHIICSVLLIFIVGVVVDLIRSFIFTSIKGIYRHFSKD